MHASGTGYDSIFRALTIKLYRYKQRQKESNLHLVLDIEGTVIYHHECKIGAEGGIRTHDAETILLTRQVQSTTMRLQQESMLILTISKDVGNLQ